MTGDDAHRFAESWIDCWNRRDIDAVLALFDDGVAFTSPRAIEVLGVGTVQGKAALRAYWERALAQISSLRFTLDRVVWDPENRELAIIYTSAIDGRGKRVSENLRFGQNGVVVAAEVFHGVVA